MPAESRGPGFASRPILMLALKLVLLAWTSPLLAQAVDSIEGAGLPSMISELRTLPGEIPIPVVEAAPVDVGGRTVLVGGMTSDFRATPAIQIRRPDGSWRGVPGGRPQAKWEAGQEQRGGGGRLLSERLEAL